MPKVLRVTGNGKTNRAIENLTWLLYLFRPGADLYGVSPSTITMRKTGKWPFRLALARTNRRHRIFLRSA